MEDLGEFGHGIRFQLIFDFLQFPLADQLVLQLPDLLPVGFLDLRHLVARFDLPEEGKQPRPHP